MRIASNRYIFLSYVLIYVDVLFRPIKAGEHFMAAQDIPYGEPWDLWQNQLGMFIFMMFFLFLTYVNLVRMDKFR